MSNPKYVLGDRNYLHPKGKHLFSGSVWALCGVLGTLQIAAIAIFAKYGYGYHYVFVCVALVHIYMYRKVFKNLKDKTEPTNLYSIVEGYLFIPAGIYSFPLVLTALLSLVSANNSMSDAFVANNQPILIWLSHFKLTALPAYIDLTNLKNSLYIHYLGLVAFSGIFSFILSLPFLGLMSKGWSDFFDANPKQFYFLRKVGCIFLAATACAWIIYTGYRDWKNGVELATDGGLRFTSWQYVLGRWAIVGCYLPIMLSAFIGSFMNVLQLLRKKSSTS